MAYNCKHVGKSEQCLLQERNVAELFVISTKTHLHTQVFDNVFLSSTQVYRSVNNHKYLNTTHISIRRSTKVQVFPCFQSFFPNLVQNSGFHTAQQKSVFHVKRKKKMFVMEDTQENK